MDKGDFDGLGHTVGNLKTTLEAKAGLFRKIVTATVKNVTVTGSISYTTSYHR